MYEQAQPILGRSARSWTASALAVVLVATLQLTECVAQTSATSAEFATPNIIRHIGRDSERLEMTTNASRILTLDTNIPRVQVNNPELIAVTPLSATQIQVSAKKPGVTQINLWDQENNLHTIDVIIYGDVRELEYALKTQFPNSSVGVRKFTNSLMLTGFVDSPDHVSPIMRLAEDYSPKVINNLEVGGVQQVLLNVKLFEVSRTKLREMGFDWANFSSGGFIASRPSGLISSVDGNGITTVTGEGGATVEFGILSGNNAFFGLLKALQDNGIAKILAEPRIVAVSGRASQFLEGGEIPVPVPQSLGTTTIEYKPYGTQVDFLPIVLGNGNIRLEVRPKVSDLDYATAIPLAGYEVPGFKVRQADTAVEMQAGQTFALAGLIQQRSRSVSRGLPWVKDVPVLGVPFRRTIEEIEEIELLILVTPEFVSAMDPHEVPPCGPGMATMSPSSCELMIGGHIEVPNAYGPCASGCNSCTPGMGCDCGPGSLPSPGYGSMGGSAPMGEMQAPAGMPYQEGYESVPAGTPTPAPAPSQPGNLMMPDTGARSTPQNRPVIQQASRPTAPADGYGPGGYGAPRTANYRRATTQSAPPTVATPSGSGSSARGGLIGPVGYDVE
ncbi:pilus assembly protein N-terminal domain-containing protein [Aeoliella sp. SH292]|uniref:type II and III secretion system protein family protein n=1 Tax=Aeoliella sp. SH292 TaxID=3454464 RepID=UPI003F95DFAD